MIKIKPYYAHPAHKKILDRYLYLAALVLPFPPEAVIGDEKLTVDGKEITAETVLQERLQQCKKTSNGKNAIKYDKDALAAYSIDSIIGSPKDEARIVSRETAPGGKGHTGGKPRAVRIFI